MSQGHVPHTQAVIHTQYAEIVLYRMAAFYSQQGGYTSSLLGANDIRRRSRYSKYPRVAVYHPVHKVNLLKLQPSR